MADQKTDVTQTDIAAGLRELGVTPGKGLVVHSSLRSFGRVVGGAESVIDALMEVVTAEGTIVMPSFNHDEPFREGGPGIYDPTTTPTSNGAIPDRFWRRPDVLRSLNPTHPFAAWGKEAQRYLEWHHRTRTMGPRSPLGLLLEDDGFCLLLGVGYRPNTFHHVVEMSTGAPCLGVRTEVYRVRLSDGRIVVGRTWSWRSEPCPFTDGQRYVPVMEKRGLQSQGLIGECNAILYRLRDCYEVVAQILHEGGDGYPPCRGCSIRPRVAAQTVESDWDPERQDLAADSVAWTY